MPEVRPDRPPIARPDGGPSPLEFGFDERGNYAIYHLRDGEALYSSVVIRFTGRIHAAEVNELAAAVACRSDIEDVTDIPTGFPVRIPVEWLSPEYLPEGDPRRSDYEESLAESSRFRSSARAASLAGIHVFLDAGHGGRDVGASRGRIWESTYIYDIYCRVKKKLEERTHATVWPTIVDANRELKVLDRDRLDASKRASLLTDPPYELDDPRVGVHLRWYLSNSRFRALLRKGVSADNVVFLSFHADSLHPSIHGAMIYVPGEKLLARSFGKRGQAYEARREWKEEPYVSFTPVERFRSEGYSRDLAEHIVGAFDALGIGVHPYQPIRSHVIRREGRRDREWVPAVLKFNRVPARAIVEVCNMANDGDLALLMTRDFREQVAEGILDALLSYYGSDAAGARAARVAGGAPKAPGRP